ncbi:uncharacterized protein EV422DRAFT_546182 [Fimicolochytrium jonesii]|uniref:uncharacterized protein n=1 Tax=Fimicolochytrium jonesii TaxID=1396493 RepID=UPI0022FE9837|nr:uncharacterized protein EV422DRAFT_546182 [Fimicolochytrium jonesii]KAI8816294.1 hypothetical protein EV422DRAFT_546182 [Fimicolochytrium jonesii]
MGETKPATTTGRPPYSPDYLRDRASMFVMVANKAIHIGGGGAHTGLYINPTLTAGETGPCQTFENAPLTGGGKEGMGFECHVVEVFAFN